MSEIAINEYLRELEKLKHLSGKPNEQSISIAFHKLLSTYAKAKDLELVAQVSLRGAKDKPIRPDGTLKDNLRLDWGYWESKDEFDDLDAEIDAKLAKGYPSDNIIFEDGRTVVLIRNGNEKSRVSVTDKCELDRTLRDFVSFERPEVREFRKAIELFKADIPLVTTALKDIIISKAESNSAYQQARDSFLQLCREVINPAITPEDIREMVVQHILTADIFNTIFDEPHFHQENNIAHELEKLTNTFFTREIRRNTLNKIKHYYDAINAQAARIDDHHEKQRFLKVVYENFYKSYNPKKADRLGVVYTPNEIVRFMIESTDYLLQRHFGKQLEDPGVEILDPATGTGTFICDLIDHISKDKLEYKYRHELHANEVEILPYYIANLNIEFTYKQKTGKYAEFENLCFVDTLDNYVNLNAGAEQDIFSLTDENAERIKRQNERKISVIIGNPPYNANQMNENENNKNREYPAVDKRIKETYIKESTAQKAKTYDMYARFLRWASDRIDKNGIIAFVSNNSFIDSKTFDGFRKTLGREFNYLYILNLKGNARTSGERRRQEGGNIFHNQIRVGIAIYFIIKREGKTGLQVFYDEVEDYAKADRKFDYLTQRHFKDIPFEHLIPDKDHNWINLVENDWDEMLEYSGQTGIFPKAYPGIKSNRDDWVYDVSEETLKQKFEYCCDVINNLISEKRHDFPDILKWSPSLKDSYSVRQKTQYHSELIIRSHYRPYNIMYYYADKYWNDRLTQNHYDMHGRNLDQPNVSISCNGIGMDKPFHVLASKYIPHHQITPNGESVALFRYDSDGTRHDNITDWALEQFRKHFQDGSIGKEDIFHYVYGVLHDPAYRAKYTINLKRSLPRVPFQPDFWRWAKWGGDLMELHLNFESVEPFPLELREAVSEDGTLPKAKLKADKLKGVIILDEQASLHGVPPSAWDYKLGNRSALEWILDQYKEKKPKDPTIARLFNTYRFADYKDKVIDLLRRVCTVSVQTMEIVDEMEKQKA